MSSKENTRTFTIVALIASAGYFAFVCIYLSAHRMMWADEFDAWNILADPSWRHAFASLNNGADSGPPLYYAIGRCLLAIGGLHPLVMRLYSAACFWLAAVVWTQVLRRYFPSVIAVFAVALAFACNLEVLDQVAQIRFYGQLVLATALAVRIVLLLEERQPSRWKWFLWSCLGGLLLVAAHPLGLIYSAAIVFAQMCTKTSAPKRAAALVGTVLSWTYLLIFFQPVKHAAETDTWLPMPPAAAVVHFYNNHPLLFGRYRYVSVACNLLLLCLAVYACVWFLRTRQWNIQRSSFVLLFYISVLLLLMPAGFAIVSHLYKPLFLGRYLLPYYLGLVTLAAAGAWLLVQRFDKRFLRMLAVPLSIAIATAAVVTFVEQYPNPVSNLDGVLRLAQSLPTVVQDDGTVRQAHFYAPTQANNLFYVIMPPPKPGQRGTLRSIAELGYEPELVFDGPFLSTHPKFFYVDGPWQPRLLNEDLRGNPEWTSEKVDTVIIRGVTYPVLEFRRAGDSASTNSSVR